MKTLSNSRRLSGATPRSSFYAFSFFWIMVFASPATAYDYPYDDPYLATVVGTPKEYRAEVPEKIPLKTRTLKKFEGREMPDVLWYHHKLSYSLARQKGKAPLIFVIAGTGGSHNTEKNVFLMRAFYQAGFHVVGLSSPSHSAFVVAASSTSVPGNLLDDATDLYNVMQRIWEDIQGFTEVSHFYLTGYSLGGTNAAFISKIDDQQDVFKFKKVMLINPSLTLYNSISKLDRMLQNVPGGMDHFHEFFDMLVQRATDAYQRSDTVEFNEELIFRAFEENRPDDEQLAAIIGAAFRLSASSMFLTSDIMTNFGFIKPGNAELTKSTSITDYLRVGMRVGFTDYFHEYFFPFFRAREPALTRMELAERMSLRHIEDYLRKTRKIAVVHNRDDVILADGEIDFFPDVFRDRAKIYPNGGHMGNLHHRAMMEHIVGYFLP